MIAMLEGKIAKKEPTLVWLKVYGVTYEVNISLNCYNEIRAPEAELLITQIIREDANLLYGFIDKNEKKMFDSLIKISGVGPKAAMAICSTFGPASFADIVSRGDLANLKRVVGIGPKTAGRILVELGGFSIEDASPKSKAVAEAMMALESLGFKKEEILKAMQGIGGEDTGNVVKEALKKLQKI
jgi:Holliday junction DNA helicase RuvA